MTDRDKYSKSNICSADFSCQGCLSLYGWQLICLQVSFGSFYHHLWHSNSRASVTCLFTVLQIESRLTSGLVSFITEEGILSPYLVLLTNVLIYIMYKSLEDRSTWITIVISLQAFRAPRKQNLFTSFPLAENVKKLVLSALWWGLSVFSSVIVHLGGFLDSSDLSDLSHFSAGLFPKVFLIYEYSYFLLHNTHWTLHV